MRRVISSLAVAALCLASTAGVRALQMTASPDRIEEDWEVVIATPDVEGAGPQVATSMFPGGDDTSPFVEFDLNFRQTPSFQPGGLQLQVWSAKQVVDSATHATRAQCNTSDETMSWTQSLSLAGGQVTYAITSGKSTTWDTFGQDNQLSVSFNTSLTALDGYSPQTSADKSGVSWESNLVSSMRLVRVRYYAGGKLIMTDTTPRVILLAQ
jgi:hypothetical protein